MKYHFFHKAGIALILMNDGVRHSVLLRFGHIEYNISISSVPGIYLQRVLRPTFAER